MNIRWHADHTVCVKNKVVRVVMLVVHDDDIVVMSNDDEEIKKLNLIKE